MKIGEIREMTTEELHGELERLRRHLFDLRVQSVTEKLQNPNQVKLTRRDIARVLTVLGERGVLNIEEHQHHLEAEARKQAAAG